MVHIFIFPFVRPGESHQRSLMILSRDSSLYHLIHILDGAPKPLVDSSQSPSQPLSKPCHLGRSSYLPVWRRISLHQKGLKLSQESRSYMQIIIYMRNASEQGNANILPGINLLLNMRPWSNLALVCLVLSHLYTRVESWRMRLWLLKIRSWQKLSCRLSLVTSCPFHLNAVKLLCNPVLISCTKHLKVEVICSGGY